MACADLIWIPKNLRNSKSILNNGENGNTLFYDVK